MKKIIKKIKQLFCSHNYEIKKEGSADPINKHYSGECKKCDRKITFYI
jgi:hypothetical protein